MRRTLVLAGFVVVAAALVVVTTPAPRPTSEALVRGARVVRSSAEGIRRIDLMLGTRQLQAERRAGGWMLEDVPASPAASETLDTLARQLATVRAVDAFRPVRFADVGLDPVAGTIVVATRHREERLSLGGLNAAGSTMYVRRGDEPRVLQVGVYFLGVVERALEAGAPGG